MKIIPTAMTSGILLTFVNIKFTVEELFNSRWGQTLILYIHIMMPKRAKAIPPPASSILMPSVYNSRKNANTMIEVTVKEGKYQNIPWPLH